MNNEKDMEEIKKKAFLKKVKVENGFIRVFSIILFVILIFFLHLVFKKSISEYELSSIISLGAILSTFGSALLAVAQVIEKDRYDRILRNVDIYFNDIAKGKPWRRWQFLKRTTKFKVFNNDIIQTSLQNPDIVFDVGSHNIEIYLPTVLEDFYDLPSFYCLYTMIKNKKHFFTNAVKEKIDLEGPSGYMGWCCLYDIWKSVWIFRVSRLITYSGIIIIFSSIAFTIYYGL